MRPCIALYLVFGSIRHPKDKHSDLAFILNSLGQLWLAGVDIDWHQFYEQEVRNRVPLPTYPFERKQYWIDPPLASNSLKTREKESSLPAQELDMADWFYVPSWKRSPLSIPEKQQDLKENSIL